MMLHDSFSPLPEWLRNVLPLALIGAASVGLGLASRVLVRLQGRVLLGAFLVMGSYMLFQALT